VSPAMVAVPTMLRNCSAIPAGNQKRPRDSGYPCADLLSVEAEDNHGRRCADPFVSEAESRVRVEERRSPTAGASGLPISRSKARACAQQIRGAIS
jgi:hypothetical protein